jgi:4-hydroxyphenylpyruvate dioxygenase-like putative hemolysin
MPIDEDPLTEIAAAVSDANEALARAAEALAGAMQEPDPESLAAEVSRGY